MLFASRGKAKRFAEKVKGDLYYYGPRSKTRDNYKLEMESMEGGFDETLAQSHPYMVSWLKKESTQ